MPSESKLDEILSADSSSSCDHKSMNENINMMHDDTGVRTEQQSRKISYDPTEYVQKARVTRAAPPPPANNPLQFVTIKPVKLYQTAHEQVKRTEEIKKTKEVRKEDAEEWQSNLDNWKSSRRKRVEHIIDRVVEVKKLELVDHDRNRKKSKTFSEMMEERGSKRKISVPIFTGEEENNDFSDLGIGTSSTSGKSSLSEDFDNHSVMSDNQEAKSEKSLDLDLVGNGNGENRGYLSSPGYDTSSSNAPASSPDPSEYTYEAAIQNYKARVSLATQSTRQAGQFSKDSTPERTDLVSRKRNLSSKIEDRLLTMEMKANGNEVDEREPVKKDLPKVDISKRRELFERHTDTPIVKTIVKEEVKVKSIKERLSNLEITRERDERKTEELPFEIPSIRERFVILEKKVIHEKPKVEVQLSASLKDRLCSLHSAVNKPTMEVEGNYKPFEPKEEHNDNDTDHEDNHIHTTDVSFSLANEQKETHSEDINRNNVLDQIVEQMSNNEHEIEAVFDNSCPDNKVAAVHNVVIPDIIQNNVAKTILSAPNIEIEGPTEDQDASVSDYLSDAHQSVISGETLLLDVKQLIDNLASDKVEGSNNDLEDTTTYNTSMFDETTATEDSSLTSLASPFHQKYSELPDDDTVKILSTPLLNLNLCCVREEEANTHEIVIDYFNRGASKNSSSNSSKNSRASSPRSPTRSILNFIKTNLLHSSSTESLSTQDKAKFYVPLEENVDYLEEKARKMSDSFLKLEMKTSIESDTTMSSEINNLLDEEISKL